MRQEVVDRIESVIKELWPSADVSITTACFRLVAYRCTFIVALAAGHFHYLTVIKAVFRNKSVLVYYTLLTDPVYTVYRMLLRILVYNTVCRYDSF